MEIAVIGVNHKKTPIDIREKFSFTESKKIEAINYLLDMNIDEVVILATCNRSEIYIATEREIDSSILNVKEFIGSFFSIDDVEGYLFHEKGKVAIEHIFNVAIGLDSIVLGEDQILGQVKEAIEISMDLGASKKVLNKLFREAVTCAKDIKKEFRISEIPLSTSYIGIKLLKEQLGTLKGKKALIVGIGQISKLALTYLKEEELEKIYLTNRTHGKLIEVSMEFDNSKVINYNNRYEVMEEVDIVITATSAPHTVFKLDNMPKLNKQLYIMDLAVPRDVDEKIGRIKGVNLYDIDDLSLISENNLKRRMGMCDNAKKIIYVKVSEYLTWLNTIRVDPVISNLNTQCKEIREDTMEYLNRKLSLDSREKKIIDKMIDSALKRVIRQPILKLKSIEDDREIDEYLRILLELFDV